MLDSPPPSTITSGSRMLTTAANARASRSAYRSSTRRASSSNPTRLITSSALRSSPVSLRYSPAAAGPDRKVSTQLERPQ